MSQNYSKDLSSHRLNKSKDLIVQAQLLFDNKQYDGCINRSYYAIFNAIRALLAFLKLDSRKHSGVITFFDMYFVKTGIFSKEFSKIVHKSFDFRQVSDYDDFYIISIDQAKLQIDNCSKFISEVESKINQLLNGEIEVPEIENKR